VSDHYHHASEIQGAADDRHGHPGLERDISAIESDLRNHRHYDLEREDEGLRVLLDRIQADLRELREDLRDALERIRALEYRQPDYADPEADDEDQGDEEGEPGEYRCAETSDGVHTARWYEGGRCAACGLLGEDAR
jgi:hypothetical protein